MKKWMAAMIAGQVAMALAADSAAPAAGTVILDASSPWRMHLLNRPPVVPVDALQAAGMPATAPVVLPVKAAWGGPGWLADYSSPPLPAEWTGLGYDDSEWTRGGLPRDFSVTTGMLAARGKFLVSDPAKFRKLQLTLKYRGGVVVYLNGSEVARVDLPDGPVTCATPAKPYGVETYVDAAGKVLTDEDHVLRNPKSDDATRVGKRNRAAGPIEIPVAALRQGVNVLAIAALRSEYQPPALKWWIDTAYTSGRAPAWAPLGVQDIQLLALGEGIESGLRPMPGVRVWNLDLHDRLDGSMTPDQTPEGLRPVNMVGVRNGFHSGALVVSGAAALKNLQVIPGDLVGPGKAKIPAAAVQARVALWADNVGHYDMLTAGIPAEIPARKQGAAAPVWLTVHIPQDAAAGEYRGEVAVAADGLPAVRCPVTVRVVDWTMPAPKDFRTYNGMCQSPDTLAAYYKVPMWSEEHWKLIEKSFELMGGIGNKLIHIPLLAQTQLGNEEGMVWWVRKPDGSMDYDFTVFDRYLELARKHCRTIEFAVCHVWVSSAWGSARPLNQELYVTCLNQTTGKREPLRVPTYATEESRVFWKPVLAAIQARLAKAGYEHALTLGNVSDQPVAAEAVKMFSEITPGAGWWRACHSPTRDLKPYPIRDGGFVSIHEHVYGMSLVDPAKSLPRIWEQRGPGATYLRGTGETDSGRAVLVWRLLPENALYLEKRGVGRECIDYWPMESRRRAYYYARYPASADGHSIPYAAFYAQPGPDGPTATIRYELFREGMQEAEAAIFIAEAAETRADLLGKELTEKCRRIFIDRIQAVRLMRAVYGGGSDTARWQQRSAELYAAAAEVAAKRGAK